MLPTFKSLHTYSASGYACTNEEPEMFRELLYGKAFRRVLSICSGGEIPLLILLPRTTREIVAVDHSKRSLMVTYLKALILNHYGPKETIDILTTMRNETSCAKVRKVVDSLPKELVTPSTYRTPTTELTDDSHNLAREWKLAREQDLRASIKKLHLLKLVQGDLTDVRADHEPFELLYFSNAFEHTDRNGRSPDPRKIEQLVVPGGLILTAYGGEDIEKAGWCQFPKPIPLGWEKLKSIKGKRASWSAYGLYQTHFSLHRVPADGCGVCGGMCEAVARKSRVNGMVVR